MHLVLKLCALKFISLFQSQNNNIKNQDKKVNLITPQKQTSVSFGVKKLEDMIKPITPSSSPNSSPKRKIEELKDEIPCSPTKKVCVENTPSSIQIKSTENLCSSVGSESTENVSSIGSDSVTEEEEEDVDIETVNELAYKPNYNPSFVVNNVNSSEWSEEEFEQLEKIY